MEKTTCPSGDLIPIPPYKEILMAGMHSQIWSIQIAPLLNFRKSKVHNSVLLSFKNNEMFSSNGDSIFPRQRVSDEKPITREDVMI